MTACPHCQGDIEIRNPTGDCDHLYYPDNCRVCKLIKELEARVATLERICENEFAQVRVLYESKNLWAVEANRLSEDLARVRAAWPKAFPVPD